MGVREQATSEEPEMSAFARSVWSLLERTEYRRCETGEDLEAIYRLRYKAFKTHGLLPDAASDKMVDAIDDAPNCYRFGIFLDNELVSTVRIHHVSHEHPFSPVMSVFGDELAPRLAEGDTFIDPSRLAVDPDLAGVNRILPYVTLRLAVIANTHFDSTSCVSIIREDHTGFYKRIFGSQQVGEPRLYPPFTVPIMLYESNCATNMRKTVERFPFFRSTPAERRMLFEKTKKGEVAPLTILPSAKYRDAA